MEPYRNWMYERNNPGRVGMREEFADGVTQFINQAKTLDAFLTLKMICCPCLKCECTSYETEKVVYQHLCRNGFMPEYRFSRNNYTGSMVMVFHIIGPSRAYSGNYLIERIINSGIILMSCILKKIILITCSTL